MQLKTKLIKILPLQTGTGRNGEWKKQDIVVETLDQYPKKICVSIWGDKLGNVALTEQQVYLIDFDVESREYNGRWYTDVKAWRIQPENAAAPVANDYGDMPPPPPPASDNYEYPFESGSSVSDLPF